MGYQVGYDRTAAVKYARNWAELPWNTKEYPSYDADCMNFVSQCLAAGGMVKKDYGYQWYANQNTSNSAWAGVDSFLTYLRRTFGCPRINYSCYSTPLSLQEGDIVFTVADGTPGDITRDASHVVILSEKFSTYNKMVVCGHTVNQLDKDKTRNDRLCTYIHINNIWYDYSSSDYVNTTDRTSAQADFGRDTLRPSSTYSTYVYNMQVRLNHLGYNVGTPDGKFGDKTTAGVKAFQTAYKTKFGLVVDGLPGEATKEALRYPAGW